MRYLTITLLLFQILPLQSYAISEKEKRDIQYVLGITDQTKDSMDVLSGDCNCSKSRVVYGNGARCIYQHATLGELSSYKKEMLQDIVQRMVDQVSGKGFRHLGDGRDFDHCHLLIEKKKPFAALCHTQERAAENKGTHFDYVNRDARNWIVWLEGDKKVENAKAYRVDGTRPEWKEWDRFGTIPPMLLDPKKIGHTQTQEDVEFFFTKMDCEVMPAHKMQSSNVIQVKDLDKKDVCLFLEDTACSSGTSGCKARCQE